MKSEVAGLHVSKEAPTEDGRLPEIDWLRLGAVVLVVVIHVAQIFSPFESWHIDSPDKSRLLGQFTVFAAPWIMPLFMLLAGANAFFSLQARSPGEYLRVRVLRLLVPLVAGIFLVIPPQIYYRRLSRGEFEGSFLEFYPRFFDGLFPSGNFSYGHLWFIAYLFLYLMAALPVFQYLSGAEGRRLMARAGLWCQAPGRILWLAVPLAVGQLLLRVRYTQTTGAVVGDWATHAWLFTSLVYGYVLMAEPRFMKGIDQGWRMALVPGVICSLGIAGFTWTGDVFARLPSEAGWGYLVFWSGFTLASWSWMVVILGWARENLHRTTPFLRNWRDTAYPLYIFHQTVVIVIAYWMVGWPLGLHTRFALITVASLASTILLMAAVRRIPGVRALFGLRGASSPPEPAAS